MSSISSRCGFLTFLRLFSFGSSAAAAARGLEDGLARFLFFTITAWRNEGAGAEGGRAWSAASAVHRTFQRADKSGGSQAHLAVLRVQAQGPHRAPVRGNKEEAPGMSILMLAATLPQSRQRLPRQDQQKCQDHHPALCACGVPAVGRTFCFPPLLLITAAGAPSCVRLL